MPVDYTIASRVTPAAGGGFDPLNAFAQMQAMDYRQQQNALAQMQMQEYQRKMQIQNALGGVLADPGFDVMSPQAVSRLVHSGNLSEGLSVLGAQRQAATLRAQEAAQQATAKYQAGMLGVARDKLPLEKELLEFQKSKEGRQAIEALRKSDIATLDLGIKKIATAQDTLSQYDPSAPDTWPDIYENIKQVSPEFAKRFNPAKAPDQKSISAAMQNADLHRRVFEDAARQQTQLEFAQPQMPSYAPGYIQRYDRATNSFHLEAPRQPGAMPLAANAMAAPSAQPQNAFTGQPLTPMTSAAPATEEPAPPMGTPAYARRLAARNVLSVANYDPEKGGAYVANLIKNTPRTAWQEAIQRQEGKITGKAPPEVQNVGRLKTILDNMVLAANDYKLGGQISDKDVELLKQAQSNMANPNIQPEERMAQWDEVMRIQSKMAGYKYIPMKMSQETGEQPIIGQRAPAAIDENAILTDVFGPKK
jgi:hypothetical protein